MKLYSIIIPVYNRPQEIDELLLSLTNQTYIHFEVIIVEDGSTQTCEHIVEKYQHLLKIYYYKTPNQGPGKARNYGVQFAKGEYIIILDSDCILPSAYMEQIHDALKHYDVDAFGGPDRAHHSFSPLQKAINYSMTSFLTTGGIRGGRKKLDDFYPRSFNMGIRREVYIKLEGFSSMRYGEDIDFSRRIKEAGYKTRLFPMAYVFHKRRTSLCSFFKQVSHSGEARVVLTKKYPSSLKAVHLLPAVFTLYLLVTILLSPFCPLLLLPIAFYALLLFLDAFIRNNRSFKIAALAVITSFVQLTGYGSGMIRRWMYR